MTLPSESRYVRVNQVLGKVANIGPIPGDLVVPWGIIFTSNLVLLRWFLRLSWQWFLFFSLSEAAWHWLLSGRTPWTFWGYLFVPTPTWCNANLSVLMSEPVKRKVGHRQVNIEGKSTSVKPFVDSVDLLAIVSLRLRGRQVGAYVLNRGKSSYRVVFEFDCQGISSALREREILAVLEQLTDGLTDLPEGETLSVHMGSVSSYQDRIEELDALMETAPIPVQFLLAAEKASIQQLAETGRRKPKYLRLYATYTVEAGVRKAKDWSESLLQTLEQWWQTFDDRGETLRQRQLASLLEEAFEDGLQQWENLLNGKLGLGAVASDEHLLWKHLGERFGISGRSELPHLWIYDGDSLRPSHSDPLNPLHPIAALLSQGVPEAQRAYVKMQREGRTIYKGGLVQTKKPRGWLRLQQLTAGAELLFREDVSDTEILCELTRANPEMIAASTEVYLRRANQTATYAKSRQRKDVRADVKTELAEEAQRRLIQGEVPIHVAWVVMVERPTLAQLERACKKLASTVSHPAELAREDVYLAEIWRQSLPVSWRKLLSRPFNRRLVYTSEEVPGLMPLSLPRTPDRQGLELIAEDGGTPVFVDLYSQHRHMLVLGKTGSGKSVLLAHALTLGRAHDFPIFVMDYPRSDGESTFGDYARFLGGAYFDISKQAINCFEPLDVDLLRSLSEDEAESKLVLYRDHLVGVLMALVCDRIVDPLLTDRCRAVFQLGLSAYFRDASIQLRAQLAREGGRGSEAWQQMPTLHDLLPFFSCDRIGIERTPGMAEALGLIELKLKSCLDSLLGRAIARPSTLATESGLTVYALTAVDDSVDAAVLALTAYASALRASLTHADSIWFIDESPILFQFPAIPKAVARLTANGRKAGIRVILAAQDPDSIAKSSVASQIFQNLSVRLTGKLSEQSVDSYAEILKYPVTAMQPNLSANYNPSGQRYRRFLLDYDGLLIQCRYYAPAIELALVANNPAEIAARQAWMEQYPDDPYLALAEFARTLQSGGAREPEPPPSDRPADPLADRPHLSGVG